MKPNRGTEPVKIGKISVQRKKLTKFYPSLSSILTCRNCICEIAPGAFSELQIGPRIIFPVPTALLFVADLN
jgi:hypothetical protein